MVSGKALRSIVAALIFSSNIVLGANNDARLPEAKPSLEVARIEMAPTTPAVPSNFPQANFPQAAPFEILSATADGDDDVILLEKFAHEVIDDTVRQGGHVQIGLLEPDAESKTVVSEAIAGEPAAAVKETDVPLPQDLKAKIRDYVDHVKRGLGSNYIQKVKDFVPTRMSIHATIVRGNLNSGIPFVLATFASRAVHIPWYAALPFAVVAGTISGLVGLNEPRLPWNQDIPLSLRIPLLLGVQDGFIELVRAAMVVTNKITEHFNHAQYLTVANHKQIFGTALMGLVSQGLYQVMTGKVFNEREAEIKHLKYDPKTIDEYYTKQAEANDMLTTRNLIWSVASVSLSAGMARLWAPAKIGFIIYTAGAFVYSAFVMKIPEKIYRALEDYLSEDESSQGFCGSLLSKLARKFR